MELRTVTTECYGETFTVVEPDYLLDISAIANCFEEYGHHPLLYTVNRLRERPNNPYTLLGNFAGSALDDIVNHPVYHIEETLRSNFREKALEYATCEELDTAEFKQEAYRQVRNLQQITEELFRHADRRKALLEPSFICEKLGVQGRVDLMTQDFSLLVEQKSGKNVFPQKHYVQVLLYYGVLACNFQQQAEHTDIRLLYSKYPLPTGLKVVKPLMGLLHEAIDFRNQVVTLEYQIARNGFGSVMPQLTAGTLNTKHLSSFFYNRYLLPQLNEVLEPLQQLPPLERAYFERMMTFVVQEQIVGKTGISDGNYSSTADLWRMTLDEKREMGNIYTGLRITGKEQSSSYNGYDTLTLSIPPQGDGFMPNFRHGDMVYLYSYLPDEVPDVRKSILYKGVIAELHADRLVVRLNDGQQNPAVFDEQGVYALEHGSSDVGSSAAIHSLHLFATADSARKRLLLGQEAPRKDCAAKLSRSYHPDYDPILLKAKQAKDYFLLIGPPGTGKTSMALRYLVEEAIGGATGADGNAATECNGSPAAVLLLAYTNRAVDEICEMLCDAHIDFVRLGSEYSCEPRFRDYLLSHRVEQHPQLHAIRTLLREARVVVSTTSTLQARPFILKTKPFATVIVDEASQILEPNIIGILSTIGKFILIGDHKQLPAVVQQSEEESAVNDPQLNAIHLDNCRNSLFERLIRTERANHRADFIGILRKQGRMHPAVAAFPALSFYADERLEAVPLPHQQEPAIGYTADNADTTDDLLKNHRLLFVHTESDGSREGISDKSNPAEARIAAELAYRIYRLNGKDFRAARSLGIIVPYRNQIAAIRKELEQYPDATALSDITIDTVERYQGSQRDVIIYSFTVKQPGQLGFLTANSFKDDNGKVVDRKLNVVLTRAREQIIIIGNRHLLGRNPLFHQLIAHFEDNGACAEAADGCIRPMESNIRPVEGCIRLRGIKNGSAL